MPLITDRATIDYIACVANAVVQVLEPEYRDLPWEMAIFDDDSVNAFAMPGGKIGVMQGILKAAQNQDQLAAVIGHEIAHVTAEHSNERANRTKISGFDPRQSVPLWQNMLGESDNAPSEFLSTHPSGEKRIDSLISQWARRCRYTMRPCRRAGTRTAVNRDGAKCRMP